MTNWDPNSAHPPGGYPPPYGASPGPPGGGAPYGGYTPPPYSAYPPAPYGAYPPAPFGSDMPPSDPLTEPLISPNYSGWWGRGVAIAKRGWRPLATLQAVGVVLALLVQTPVAVYTTLVSEDLNRDLARADATRSPDLGPVFALAGLSLLSALVAVVVSAMVTLAAVYVGVSIAVRGEVRLGDALRLAVRRALPLLGWQLLAVPLYVVGVCLCVLPVFYVAAVFLVLPAAVAIERGNAFGRCFSLFHRDLGVSVGRLATILGLSIGASLVGALFGLFINGGARASLPGTTGVVVGEVVTTLLSALIAGALAILIAPLTLTAYADMRARVEPVNTPMIAQQLGIAPPAQQPSARPPAPPPPSPMAPPPAFG
ncbi:hypothetical protein [Rhizomonospora bruguierae]|uniref:hypothetical protein n=1 Tax=Rhizomonospora bruguierae TaxID=1581705 RepID=UPI001BCE2C2F|nr:hypothetical protein [Micromonospora sp. NBRC 107566]